MTDRESIITALQWSMLKLHGQDKDNKKAGIPNGYSRKRKSLETIIEVLKERINESEALHERAGRAINLDVEPRG